MGNETMNDFTLVVGVDAKTGRQLQKVWPTWRDFHPELLDRRMIIFYDRDVYTDYQASHLVDHPNVATVPWPPPGVEYQATRPDKWGNPQRHKMLAGFVHVPAAHVVTPYWMKIDTDVQGCRSDIGVNIQLENAPAIIAPAWGYTKPADQMERLDAWALQNHDILPPHIANGPPLGLKAPPGATKLVHPRICSWVAYFNTAFTKVAAHCAAITVGSGKLPAPSQDGYLWYLANRAGLSITKVNMRHCGWSLTHHSQLV